MAPCPFTISQDVSHYEAKVKDFRLPNGRTLFQELCTLVDGAGWPGTTDAGGIPLPRLHFDRHLLSPLLLKGTGEWAKHITLNPPGLVPTEETMVRDLRAFWQAHHQDPEYQDLEIFLWRNPSKTGVGFFQRSGFYPDFLLWLRRNGWTHLRFIEPHGMLLSQGVMGNRDKFEALRQLPGIGQCVPEFQHNHLSMDGCIISPSPLRTITPDHDDLSAEKLEHDGVLRFQDPQGGYIERLLHWPGPPLCP